MRNPCPLNRPMRPPETMDDTALLPRSALLLSAFDGPQPDWMAAAKYLSARGIELDLGFTPRRFATGHANLNFLVRCGEHWAVLRRPPNGPLPAGAHDMAREHKVLSRLHEQFPLAPRSLAYCADESVLGAPFLLVEYRDGIVISGSKPAHVHLDRERGAQLSRQMIRVLTELHRVDPRAVGLDGLGRPDGFLQRAVKGWGQRAAQAWGANRPPEAEAVLAWLTTHIPAARETSLLHCDFKLDNFIVDPDTLEPVALVDWDMSTRGDPLFDLATLLSYWADANDPEVMHDLDQMPTAQPGFASRDDALQAYAIATRRDVSQFLFHRVLCLLKLAVVFAQLHKRWDPVDPGTNKYARFEKLSLELLKYCDSVRQGHLH
ncbi:conserved hypothetical protein [Paraburkholderia piptadeniae]|uniref:Aminoglycoside phosphotransferase domain-containing protein n=2 Tax=Paraburkholderia piptadeniae TaxID=1701573 RepID=A0A1N7RIK0_9BURK|nr:conserved hypothetical protein [Paraburkholderia piptadeniae]